MVLSTLTTFFEQRMKHTIVTHATMPFKITIFCRQQTALHRRNKHDRHCWCEFWHQFPLCRERSTSMCRLQLERDGTRWRTGGEVKGKLANGVSSQYLSHYLGTWCIQHYYRWWAPRLPVVDWTDAPADLNGLVCFAERGNLVSTRVPSHFKRSLPPTCLTPSNLWVCTISQRSAVSMPLIC